MSLKQDMQYGVHSGKDNFHCQLIQLIMKANPQNKARLAKAFPNTWKVFRAWYFNAEIPDLPYEGQYD